MCTYSLCSRACMHPIMHCQTRRSWFIFLGPSYTIPDCLCIGLLFVSDRGVIYTTTQWSGTTSRSKITPLWRWYEKYKPLFWICLSYFKPFTSNVSWEIMKRANSIILWTLYLSTTYVTFSLLAYSVFLKNKIADQPVSKFLVIFYCRSTAIGVCSKHCEHIHD